MRRGLFICWLGLGLAGCGGEIGMTGAEQAAYAFDSLVSASPDRLQPGQRVTFKVEVKNHSSVPVLVDLTLRLVEEKTEAVVFTQVWDGVHFDLGEVLNLTDSFLSASDTVRSFHRVELEARAVETGEVIWENKAATRVEFGL